MKTTWRCLLGGAFLTVALVATATTQSPVGRAFGRLGELVGDWEGTLPDGRTHRVTYRWTAANGALVETWTLGPDRESMTVYHRDGDALLATHYCPQMTFPRLRLVDPEAETLDFTFLDGANLHDPAKSRQHAFTIRLVDADTFERSETYVPNAATAEEIAAAKAGAPVTFKRVRK
jgi:hypothetical protein